MLNNLGIKLTIFHWWWLKHFSSVIFLFLCRLSLCVFNGRGVSLTLNHWSISRLFKHFLTGSILIHSLWIHPIDVALVQEDDKDDVWNAVELDYIIKQIYYISYFAYQAMLSWFHGWRSDRCVDFRANGIKKNAFLFYNPTDLLITELFSDWKSDHC